MMLISLRRWRDLTDGHLYGPGDEFPHDGREIDPARIAELSGSENKAKMRLIEAVPEKGKENQAETAAKPHTAPKTPRGRKKAEK